MLTHACELCSGLMWSLSDFTCVLSFLQKRQDICNRHGWTHPITSVSIFIVYGLASRALRCAVIIERYETPSTRDSLLTSAILFTQDRRGGCLRMHALRTHTAPFKVLHLSCFVSSYTRCPSVPYWTRLILLVCRMFGSTQLRVHLSRCLCSLALYSLETLFCVNCGG